VEGGKIVTQKQLVQHKIKNQILDPKQSNLSEIGAAMLKAAKK
jgi:hypothetical protein